MSAWIDGAAVSLGGPRQAAVLARLLLTPRHVVSLDQFVDSIWDSQIPNRPDVAIRSYISNLRRLIEPDRKQRGQESILTNTSAGYRLDIEPSQIDWVKFETAVNNARSMLHNGEYATATSELRQARSLWQGEPLSGVPDSEFFSAHRNRLEELRAVALEFMYEAQLGRGDHLSVAADIEQAIAGHPFRERLTELGMIALYRSGRQSAALALGQQLRERLIDSLGIDPSPRIANIELQILNHDPQLRDHRPDPGPTPAPSVRSTGYRPDALDEIDGETQSGGQAPSPAGTRSARITGQWFLRRPTDDSTIFGRHEELAEIVGMRARLDDNRLAVVVITGEPGAGKTALMTEAARAIAIDRLPVTTAVGTEFAAPKFWLWRQIVADLANRGLGPSAVDSPRDQARFAPLLALGPNIEGAVGLGTAAGQGREYDDEAVMMAIVDYVGAVGSANPLVVVIDDLHRADQRSVDTLRYLVSRLGSHPIIVLVAWQQATLPPERPRGLRELATIPHALRIGLAGLDTVAISELAASAGQNLAPGDAEDLREAAAGNPALVQELLRRMQTDAGSNGGTGQPLQESTVGQVDQLGDAADWILAVAATFDGSFPLDWIADLVETPEADSPQSVAVDRGNCHDIIRAAVSQGFLVELPDSGWFEFRHPIMREALVETLLAVDRAWLHGRIGRRFLANGIWLRALHHLAAAANADDRNEALELGLRLSGTGPGFITLGDSELKTLESLARAEIHNAESRKAPGPLTCQAAIFLGWRATQHGDRAAGQRWARSALKLALAVAAPLGRKGSRKSTTKRDLHQLGLAALNVAGFSPHPQPGGRPVIDRDHETLELLERAVSVLPADSEALPVLEIELEWLSGSLRPSNASLKKAKSLVEQAKGLDDPHVAAMATQTFLRRFGRAIPTTSRIDYVHQILDEDSNLSERLMLAFVEHRALLELGRLHEATSLIRGLWTEAKTLGTAIDIGAARVLTIRHYLWTGDLGEAEQRLINYQSVDRPTPVDLAAIQVEQRTELGRLLARNDYLGATNRELAGSTMEPATKAALLCQVGDLDRAQEFLDQAVERITIGRARSVDEAAVARVASAASILQRPTVAAAVLPILQDLENEMLVTNNNSILLGPASYYLGLAAATVGNRTVANEAFDAAVATALSSGGKPLAVQALVAQAKQAADYTDRDEVESLLRQAKELANGLDLGWLDRQVI